MNMIQKEEVTVPIYGLSGIYEGDEQVEFLSGWLLQFYAYYNDGHKNNGDKIRVDKFEKLANQMLVVPFEVKDLVHNKNYYMEYKVGFIGCEQNDKNEVYPVQGWLVSL